MQEPGRAVVGRITDGPAWEAELVLTMRLWMDGPEGQAEVWNGFARCFGVAEARRVLNGFEALLTTLCAHARRPLTRHGLGCTCVGADEALLQTLVREAARGDLPEATMIAGLIVRATYAETVALMAAQVGLAMQDMARRSPLPTLDIMERPKRVH